VGIDRNTQIEAECGEPFRVMLVDDHARVRQCLRIFLSTCEDMQVVSEAGGADEALRRFIETRPDVVVMDLAIGGRDGAVVTARMRQIDPHASVIALTSFPDLELSRRALEAGAVCCLLKDESADVLLEAMRSAISKAPAGRMTFGQVKTGGTAEPKAGSPSDGGRVVTA
jgi:DNA-binding NarL/FixJ family response regulator